MGVVIDINDKGEYLCSDQGTEVESAILDKLTEVKHALESLTFGHACPVELARVRDTALLQCEALWRTIYYANGS